MTMSMTEITEAEVEVLQSSQGSFDFAQVDPTGLPVENNTTQIQNSKKLFQKIQLQVSSEGKSRKIAFATTKTSLVTLSLYDNTGRFIKNVYQKTTQPGNHSLRFDVSGLSSGAYVLKGYAGFNSLSARLSVAK